MITTNEPLPRIYTARLLKMNDGDVLNLGDGHSIRCLDVWRKTYEYHHVGAAYDAWPDPVPLAWLDGVWVSARWSDRRAQWTCADLAPGYDAVYAFSRTLQGLWGVRTYKRPGALIRSVLARQGAI